MSTAAMLATECAGERVLLSHERALYWPRRRTLWIADPHFGKTTVFRRAGIALPAGTTANDLERLQRLIAATGAEKIVVLGDFFHARPRGDEAWLNHFRDFLDKHRALTMEVVLGNHDTGAKLPAAWPILWRDDPIDLPPFIGVHHPQALAGGYALSGHLHPAAVVTGGGDRLRLSVFWLRPDYAVLPAFGGFTGMFAVNAAPGDRLFALGPDGVVALAQAASVAASNRRV